MLPIKDTTLKQDKENPQFRRSFAQKIKDLSEFINAGNGKPKDYSSLAYCYYQCERLDSAKEYWSAAYKADKNNIEYANNLGMVCYWLGDANTAKKHLESILNIYPDDGVLLNNYGVILLDKMDYDGAAEKFYRAMLSENKMISQYAEENMKIAHHMRRTSEKLKILRNKQ
jgi:Tfp pilus assembly protein PilF